MNTSSRAVIGAIILIVGIILLADTIGVTALIGVNAGDIIGTLWPLILVAVGFNLFAKQQSRVGVIFIGLGLLFLISEVFDVNVFSTLWPLFIIFIGLSLLIKWPFNNTQSSQTTTLSKLDSSAIFWGLEQSVTSQDFQGGEVNAIFGGVELDLRGAKLTPNGATIEANAIFGGIEIKVSSDAYRVEAAGDGIAGGWENNFTTSASSDLPLLRIKGSAVFGGVSITN